jgi:hypothetical protein
MEKSESLEIASEQTPQSLLTLAITKGADVDQLAKLMDLQERWEKNQARKAFLNAFGKFQGEVPKIEKKKQVAFGNTKYKYAEISEIADTIKDALLNNGLSYRWEIEEIDNNIRCTCIVSHTDGHSESTAMSASKDTSGNKNDIQARGSAITYLQRYSLIGALGLTTAQEDVDGQQEEKHTTTTNSTHTNGKIEPNKAEGAELPWLSEKDYEVSLDRINKGDLKELDRLRAAYRMKKIFREELEKAHEFASKVNRGTSPINIGVSDEVAHAVAVCDDNKCLEQIWEDNPSLHNMKEFIDLIKNKKKDLLLTTK